MSSNAGSESTRPATVYNNYNYKALVQVQPEKPKTTTNVGQREATMAWARPGQMLEGKPLEIEHNDDDVLSEVDEFPPEP